MSAEPDVHARCIRFNPDDPPRALQHDTPERHALAEQIYAVTCRFEAEPSGELASELGAALLTMITTQHPADRADAFCATIMGLFGWAHRLLDRAARAPLSADN